MCVLRMSKADQQAIPHPKTMHSSYSTPHHKGGSPVSAALPMNTIQLASKHAIFKTSFFVSPCIVNPVKGLFPF